MKRLDIESLRLTQADKDAALVRREISLARMSEQDRARFLQREDDRLVEEEIAETVDALTDLSFLTGERSRKGRS